MNWALLKKQFSFCISTVAFAVIGSGCAESSFNSGARNNVPNSSQKDGVKNKGGAVDEVLSGSTKPKEEDATKSSPNSDQPLNTAAECNEHGRTAVRLLTSSIKNNGMNQFLKYEVSITDCDGNPKPLTADSLFFDIDATFKAPDISTGVTEVGFSLSSNEVSSFMVKGNLQMVRSSDLFGNTGSNYYHHKTDKAFEIPKGLNKVIFTLDLSGWSHHLSSKNGGYGNVLDDKAVSYPPKEVCKTFLRFGQASPVEQPVEFLNQ